MDYTIITRSGRLVGNSCKFVKFVSQSSEF